MDKHILALLTWEDIKEIVNVADELASEDPNEHNEQMVTEEAYYREVVNRLWGDDEHKATIGERYKELLAAAEEVTGHKLDATRSNENTLIRKMVAHRLIDEGYGCSEIGRAMGKHHATVLHLNRCMVDMLSLPACYKPELCMYREFEARTAAQMAAKEEDT